MMKILGAMVLIMAIAMLLAGCSGGGSGSGSAWNSDGSTIVTAGLPTDGSGTDDGGDGSGDIGGGFHNPEPATLGLLSSGLFAYSLYRRRKK